MRARYTYNPDYAVHPGETLREKLEELGMSPKEFAVRTGKPVKTISEILNGKSSITSEMSVLFEKILKIPASFWIKKQSNYNEFVAREKHKQEIQQTFEWVKLFPYPQMAKIGLVKATRKSEEKAEELLHYFNVSKPSAWENIYLNQKTPVFFRISLKHTKNPYALSALLRMGEIQAQKIQAPPFDKVKAKELIPLLKSVMADAPADFLQQIQQICQTAGIKVVYVPNLPQTVTNGVVRWIDRHPVILMTDRYKKYDVFWFSFFHELGHIMLHANKKNIFLEESNPKGQSKEEKEADLFAENIVLPETQYKEINIMLETESDPVNVADHYAKKYNTHRDIILGRFLKENTNKKYNYLFSMIKKVDFDELIDY